MDDLRILKELKRYRNGKFELLSDLVVQEISMNIRINGKKLLSIACLPENLIELATGFLFAEGLVIENKEIISVKISKSKNEANFRLQIPEERISSFLSTGEKTSGCGSSLSAAVGGSKQSFSSLNFEADTILHLMREFQAESSLFKQTGGVHKAALIRENRIIYSADDIGRHNAVDKVAGMAILDNNDPGNYCLLCSGRISSEIVRKSVRLGFPLIISHSAVTSEAIRLGWKFKIFLIGFTRGNRFNIYTGFEENIFV